MQFGAIIVRYTTDLRGLSFICATWISIDSNCHVLKIIQDSRPTSVIMEYEVKETLKTENVILSR